MEFLRGKRTYIVAGVLIGTAILSLIDGETSIMQTVETILVGLGLGTLRAGVANDSQAA